MCKWWVWILQAKVDGVQEANAILRNNNEIAINNAIKEFADRVKSNLIEKGFYPAIVKNVLEETQKELVGEDNVGWFWVWAIYRG